MNAPFSPSGGPDPRAGDEPELRSLLQAEAMRQPPVSPDLRAGVDRRIRRHRVQMAVLVAPVVAIVLVGAVLLAPRSTPETVLDTASSGAVQDGEAEAPAPEAAPPVDESDCGSVELGPERLDPETAPLDCFIAAFNAGADATLAVVVHGPDGGTLTQTVTTAPGKQVTVAVQGSVSMQAPSFGLGKGGGIVPTEPDADAAGAQDCGTLTFTQGTAPERIAPETMSCLFDLVTSGAGGGLTIVTNDATGGTMTVGIDISSSQLITVSVDGTLTQALADLEIPSDLTSQLPPNGIGIDELLELGGLDGDQGMAGGERPGS